MGESCSFGKPAFFRGRIDRKEEIEIAAFAEDNERDRGGGNGGGFRLTPLLGGSVGRKPFQPQA
jgi:hypothetical protein